jgi:hypothetical protein
MIEGILWEKIVTRESTQSIRKAIRSVVLCGSEVLYFKKKRMKKFLEVEMDFWRPSASVKEG